MTFTSDEEHTKLSPEALRKKLEDVELSEEQKLIGDIITENEVLTYKKKTKTIEMKADQSSVDSSADSSADSMKEKKKFKPFFAASLVSLVVLAIIIGFAFSPLFDLAKEAIAGNEKGGYETESNDYDVKGEGLSDSNASVDVLTASTDKWENIENIKTFLPELLIPEYMPEGAEFVNLEVSKWEENGGQNYEAEYNFKAIDGNYINIMQNKADEKFDEKGIKQKSEFKRIMMGEEKGLYRYYEDNPGTGITVAIINDKRISIAGTLTENEVIKILENMR